MGRKKRGVIILLVFTIFLFLPTVFAATYIADVNFLTGDTVYSIGDAIEIKGSVFLTTYNGSTTSSTLTSNHSAITNATLNLTVVNKVSNASVASYYLNTTNEGLIFSRTPSYPNEVLVSAPSPNGTYLLYLSYNDPNNASWWTYNEILVMNATVDTLEISTDKVSYKSGETLTLIGEAVRLVGDKRTYIANVTINGSIQNSSKAGVYNFSCITTQFGRCFVTTTAPSNLGYYIVEIDNYKSFTRIKVEDFTARIAMKDNLGKTIKHIFTTGEDASVEVSVPTTSTSETYTFVGTVRNTAKEIVENISSTTLFINNTYTNKYTWTLDAIGFPKGKYFAEVNVSKSGGNTIQVFTTFEMRTWSLLVKSREVGSNFTYGYSAFPEDTVHMDMFPTWRVNGSIIADINVSTSINISLTDSFGTVLGRVNASWNATCSVEGCYQFSVVLPNKTGTYDLNTVVVYDTDEQSYRNIIRLLNITLTGQSTNADGALKELFGTTEFVYLSLTAKNKTSITNLTNASIVSITFMNGSEISYTEVTNFTGVNASNTVSEWAWNSTLQRLKLDAPTTGGLYNVEITGDNNTAATTTRFIVNPYDICVVAKDTPGSVSSGYYYTYQFKTSDTIYFELKAYQADNPVGRAGFGNATNSSYGLSTACTDRSTSKQALKNASVTIDEVRNLRTGKVFAFNQTSSGCQADDNSGGYSCTVAPNGSWDGGEYGVKFKLASQDGKTTDIDFGGFEARAFYLYAYTSNWRNKPNSNISLTVQMYEAGSNWWGSIGSSGLSGTATLEKIEYMGRPGEWVWPPVSSDYNTTNVTEVTITNGQGTLTLPVNFTKNGVWKTGSYRAVIKGTDSKGQSDYGYGWFEIRQWDVYGSPVDCTGTVCTSAYNLNSKDNVTLYITIMNAGEWGTSGTSLGGNVSIKVSKIQDCRKWPCSDLNKSAYNASSLIVNKSNGWYWGTSNLNKNYTIAINNTQGTWGSGYWYVIFDVNGTETGSAWFNTIAFYAEAKPTDISGATHTSSIKNAEDMYFKVSTTRAQKGGYYYGSYNLTDYINTTIDDMKLMRWDENANKNVELNYPEDVNVSIVNGGTQINGTKILNVTYINGSNWQSGYYYGELNLKDIENQTSTAWLWFEVRPFRVSITTNSSTVDIDGCITGHIAIYTPGWSSNTLNNGTYNITKITERTWSGNSYSVTTLTNYSRQTRFVNSTNVSFCPNNANWGAGSWGNYHYLNVLVQDLDGNTETGWAWFRATAFTTSWGSISNGTNIKTSSPITVPINLSRSTSGAEATGNLSTIYQWRWDSYSSSREEYVFNIGQCWSNVSGSCNITGTKNVRIFPPAGGWRIGYNYLRADWKDSNNNKLEDYNGVWFNGQEAYRAVWSNYNSSNQWQYYFSPTENLSIKLNVYDTGSTAVSVNVTKVEYSSPSTSCWSDYCKTWNTANYIVGTSSTNTTLPSAGGYITIIRGSSNWTKGYYNVRATVADANSSGGTTSLLSGGYFQVKDLVGPTVNLTAPSSGYLVNTSAFDITWTTSEAANCYLAFINHQNFRNWYCLSSWYSSYGMNSSAEYCNTSTYTGTSYHTEYINKDYQSKYTATTSTWGSGATGLSTGGTSHSYTMNVSDTANQDYGLQINCYDEDWNGGYGWAAIKVNASSATTAMNVTLLSPLNASSFHKTRLSLSQTSLFVNYSVSGVTKTNCTLYGDFDGTWKANKSQESFNTVNAFTVGNISNGTYTWNVLCADSANTSKTAWGKIANATPSNFTFEVNTSVNNSVYVTLITPSNDTQLNFSTVSLNFTVEGPMISNCNLYTNRNLSNASDANAAFIQVNASLNNTVRSHTINHTFANLTWNNGTYLWNVKCTDASNSSNYAVARANFTVWNLYR